MKVAFFDTKPYDREAFAPYETDELRFKFYETKLTEDTVTLARGCEAVCVFVNDTVNAAVIDGLCELGVRVVALRCAGFNNVDLGAACKRLDVVRVPKYSPYAVAEYTVGLLLCLNRCLHRAFCRIRENNFSINGFLGFDVHGKTVGIIGILFHCIAR